MTRSHRTFTILTALFAGCACAASLAQGALAASAATGGSSAPAGAQPTTKARGGSIATWFGPGFYGQKTACGQTLTPAVVGVANRTLPCGTLVQVSYRGQRGHAAGDRPRPVQQHRRQLGPHGAGGPGSSGSKTPCASARAWSAARPTRRRSAHRRCRPRPSPPAARRPADATAHRRRRATDAA